MDQSGRAFGLSRGPGRDNRPRPRIYITDSLYVVRGFFKLRRGRWSPKSHRDLWHSVKNLLEGRDVRVLKVASHLTEKEQRSASRELLNLSVVNEAADGLADHFSDPAQVPSGQAQSLLELEEEARLIRKRILAITASFPPKVRAEGPAETGRGQKPLLDLPAARAETCHAVHPRRWRCLECGSEPVSKGKRVLIHWLKQPCRPGPAALGRAVGPSRRGLRAHPSHVLRWFDVGGGGGRERILACEVCGGLGTHHFREEGKLLNPCRPPTRTGRIYLNRLNQGLSVRAVRGTAHTPTGGAG